MGRVGSLLRGEPSAQVDLAHPFFGGLSKGNTDRSVARFRPICSWVARTGG
jgi:hypothetical protein